MVELRLDCTNSYKFILILSFIYSVIESTTVDHISTSWTPKIVRLQAMKETCHVINSIDNRNVDILTFSCQLSFVQGHHYSKRPCQPSPSKITKKIHWRYRNEQIGTKPRCADALPLNIDKAPDILK